MDWIGLHWIALDWIGLDWIGLGRETVHQKAVHRKPVHRKGVTTTHREGSLARQETRLPGHDASWTGHTTVHPGHPVASHQNQSQPPQFHRGAPANQPRDQRFIIDGGHPKVFTKAPALHSVTIFEHRDVLDVLELMFHIRDIRKLTIDGCWLGDDNIGPLSIIVALYPNLEGLSLTGSSPFWIDDYCLIGYLKKLSELDLSQCEYLSGESIRLIADGCQYLKILRLYGVRLIDYDVIHVTNKLGKQLTTLELDGTDLTDVAFSYLKNFTRLQKLEVFYCEKMTDRSLLQGIGLLQELTSLHLNRGRNLTAQALSTFLHRPSMTSIVSLELSICSNLDDEGLKGIAERCINLKELEVSGCDNVTDAGIHVVISHCSLMCELILKFLPSVRGEGWLALVPSHLPHLRSLYLLSCYNVVHEYVEELRAAVPELEIAL